MKPERPLGALLTEAINDESLDREGLITVLALANGRTTDIADDLVDLLEQIQDHYAGDDPLTTGWIHSLARAAQPPSSTTPPSPPASTEENSDHTGLSDRRVDRSSSTASGNSSPSARAHQARARYLRPVQLAL